MTHDESKNLARRLRDQGHRVITGRGVEWHVVCIRKDAGWIRAYTERDAVRFCALGLC